MVFVVAVCSNADAEGVNVICPAVVMLYADALNGEPFTVIAEVPVIAALQALLSANVIVKGPSTVGLVAGVMAGIVLKLTTAP